MELQFEFLADRSELVPQVISWWHTVWADRMGSDLERASEQLRASLSKDTLPIHLLVSHNGEAIGSAALKEQELEELFPDNKYWLGSVFVAEKHRGGGVASAITLEIVKLARAMELPHLYLQTLDLDGGLYSRLGWIPLQQFDFKQQQTLLMKKELQTTELVTEDEDH